MSVIFHLYNDCNSVATHETHETYKIVGKNSTKFDVIEIIVKPILRHIMPESHNNYLKIILSLLKFCDLRAVYQSKKINI